MSSLYRRHILDHYKTPRNAGELQDPDLRAEVVNASCGDEITVTINLEGDVVKEIKHDSRGCAISIATISMLSDKLVGKTVEELKQLPKSEVLELTGLTQDSGRVKCGLIAWEAITKASEL